MVIKVEAVSLWSCRTHLQTKERREIRGGSRSQRHPTHCGAETMAMEAKKPLVSPRAKVPAIGQMSLTKITGR